MIHLDTHIVVWLYAVSRRLPKKIKEFMETDDLGISPMVMLELEYLFEIGKFSLPAHDCISDLSARIGLSVLSDPFEGIMGEAVREKWTRDPFDRVITAHARFNQAKLITRDRSIRRHYPHAIWL